MSKFTIVIPCKNEEGYIGELLDSISKQSVIPNEIIIADANSTDRTIEIVIGFKDRLNIRIIEGGNVSYGRNKGASLCFTKYIIFIDSDMVLKDIFLLEETISKMESSNLKLSTCNIRCLNDNKISDMVYIMNNISQKASKLIGSPFSTGSYMCIEKDEFDRIGGFDTEIQFSEDYWLSKQVDSLKFGIVDCNIHTSDRRFKKIGYFWMIKNFTYSFLNRNNRDFFIKDFKYWI